MWSLACQTSEHVLDIVGGGAHCARRGCSAEKIFSGGEDERETERETCCLACPAFMRSSAAEPARRFAGGGMVGGRGGASEVRKSCSHFAVMKARASEEKTYEPTETPIAAATSRLGGSSVPSDRSVRGLRGMLAPRSFDILRVGP